MASAEMDSQYIYRSAGDDNIDVSVGSASISAGATPAESSWYSRLGWMGGMLGLTIALAIVAFVIVLVLYFQVQTQKKQIKEIVCTEIPRACGKGGGSLFRRAGLSYLGHFSSVTAALPQLTGFTASPLMLMAATPVGTTVSIDAQTGPSSVIAAPYSGYIEGISVQINALPSAGWTSVMATIDGVAQTASEVKILPATGTTSQTVMFTCPLKFKVGQTLGLTQNVAAGTVSPATSLVLTAQPLVKWMA